MALQVSSLVLDRLIGEAGRAHPRECCGLLLGEGGDTGNGESEAIAGVMPAENIHPDPVRHFEIDPQTLIEAHRAARSGGPPVVGYYHSHPNGLPAPSATDQELAAGDGAVWAIIAAGGVRFFRAGAGGFVALPYEVTGR